jgi:hypothetical protein
MAKKSVRAKIKKAMREKRSHNKVSCRPSRGCGYFLGFVGAAVYYISTATGFWNGVWGVVKALLWPAFLIFELLKFIGA